MTNPLLAEWTGPFGLPPFDAIEDADFGLFDEIPKPGGEIETAAQPPQAVGGDIQRAHHAAVAGHVGARRRCGR